MKLYTRQLHDIDVEGQYHALVQHDSHWTIERHSINTIVFVF